jgi:hypothetical protein
MGGKSEEALRFAPIAEIYGTFVQSVHNFFLPPCDIRPSSSSGVSRPVPARAQARGGRKGEG